MFLHVEAISVTLRVMLPGGPATGHTTSVKERAQATRNDMARLAWFAVSAARERLVGTHSRRNGESWFQSTVCPGIPRGTGPDSRSAPTVIPPDMLTTRKNPS